MYQQPRTTELLTYDVSSANSAVKREDTDCVRWKRKYTTTFIPEDRTKVGKCMYIYALKNGVAKAQKNFRKLNLSD